jgi:TonB-linked SusC/RagA family outer membrane protein
MQLTVFDPGYFRGSVPHVKGHLTQKMLRIMKLLPVFLVMTCLQVAARSEGQTVTLSVKNVPMKQVFREIQKQTGLNVLVSEDLLAKAGLVTLHIRNMPVAEVLNLCLHDKPIGYVIEGETIVVRMKPAVIPQPGKTPAPIITPPPLLTVHGLVTNEKGEPVTGALVKVKNSDRAAITNEKGEFVLKGLDEKAILVVSSVNIVTKEIELKGRTEIAITAVLKVNELENVGVSVVSTGYQTLPKERATGSFAQPDKEMFDGRVSTDVISKLEGITSGVAFNRNSLGGATLQIRGASTINANASPLIVVDNFPYDGDITNINPNDVEGVTILKDAAAASIWGARAGNGVIVVTTKKGKFNQPLRVDMTANVTVSGKPDLSYNRNFLKSNDFINVEQSLFAQGFYDADLSNTQYPPISPVVEILAKQRAGTLSAADATSQIDAFRNNDIRNDLKKYYYHGIANQQYALNISGGNQYANYVMSVGYDHDLSNLVNNTNHRTTTNALATFRPVKKLELTGGISYIQGTVNNNNTLNDVTTGGPSGKSIYPYAQLADGQGNPLPVVKDYRTSFVQSAVSKGFLDWSYYPLKDMQLADNTTASYDIRLRAGLKYEIIPGLSLEGLYQYETGNNKNRVYHDDSSYYARNIINEYSIVSGGMVTGNNIPVGGMLDVSNIGFVSNNGRGQLNFNRSFHLHTISAIAGIEAREMKGETQYNNTVYGYDPTIDSYGTVNYNGYYSLYPSGSGAVIPNNFTLYHTLNRNRSYFSNVSYSYKDRYTVSASGRVDQANLFGQKTNAKSVPLWSVGGKWNVSKEAFYHSRWLPYLQLRVTYGYQGNLLNDGTAYTTARYITGTANLYPPYYTIYSPGNPELTWERIGMVNMGADFSIAKNILSGSLEYYFKNGTHLIGAEPVPSSTGFTSATINYANMKGSGFDVTLNSKNINGAFQWSTGLLLSYNTNKVTNYTGNAGIHGGSNIIVGKPIDGLYTYKWAGLDPANGNPRGYDTAGKISEDYATLLLADAQHSQYSGRLNPAFIGGLRNTFSYKGFSLSINLSFKLNYYFVRSSINYYDFFYYWQGNVDYANRWQKPGDEKTTNVPSMPMLPINQSRDRFYNGSYALVTKGDHLRIQDALISYDFDQLKWQFLPFRHIQLLAYANNLGLLWKANKYNIDPDFYGADYVNPKSFSFSLKANF